MACGGERLAFEDVPSSFNPSAVEVNAITTQSHFNTIKKNGAVNAGFFLTLSSHDFDC